MRSWRYSAALLVLSGTAAAGVVILYNFEPTTAGFFPQCVFHAVTTLQCPGCGITRAVHRLLHGEVGEALRLNAMIFVAVPFMVIVTISRRVAAHPMTGWAALVATLAWWIGRNLV